MVDKPGRIDGTETQIFGPGHTAFFLPLWLSNTINRSEVCYGLNKSPFKIPGEKFRRKFCWRGWNSGKLFLMLIFLKQLKITKIKYFVLFLTLWPCPYFFRKIAILSLFSKFFDLVRNLVLIFSEKFPDLVLIF